jgi:3-hydroxyacyl-[acyl-carrier-protein] dehydratase
VSTVCDAAVSFSCFNREGLAEILPHRGSALRKIDGVFFNEKEPSIIIGIKKVEPDDPDLDGHFPGVPTYPGYAQDEFACLAAAALILYPRKGQTDNPHVVHKVAKYKKPVMPGDTLRAEVRLVGRKSRFFLFSADIRNQHNEVVAEYEKIVGVL